MLQYYLFAKIHTPARFRVCRNKKTLKKIRRPLKCLQDLIIDHPLLNILRGCSCTGCTAKERNYHIHKRTSKCTVFDFNAACSKVSHICPINCLNFQKPWNGSWRIGVSISANTEEGNDIFCFGSEYQCFNKQKNGKENDIYFFLKLWITKHYSLL